MRVGQKAPASEGVRYESNVFGIKGWNESSAGFVGAKPALLFVTVLFLFN
jgi:hypothetical protein